MSRDHWNQSIDSDDWQRGMLNRAGSSFHGQFICFHSFGNKFHWAQWDLLLKVRMPICIGSMTLEICLPSKHDQSPNSQASARWLHHLVSHHALRISFTLETDFKQMPQSEISFSPKYWTVDLTYLNLEWEISFLDRLSLVSDSIFVCVFLCKLKSQIPPSIYFCSTYKHALVQRCSF